MNHAIQDLETINLKNNESIKESVQISRELTELSNNLSILINELVYEGQSKQKIATVQTLELKKQNKKLKKSA